jgi:hypothetical protein
VHEVAQSRKERNQKKNRQRVLENTAVTKMAHQATDVSRVKNPANGFGKTIAGIDNTGNLGEIKVTGFLPVLEGKVLYIDVAGAFGRAISIGHLYC